MRPFDILREEHFLFERTMKVLNRFLIAGNFNHQNFFDFFLSFHETLLTHLAKERILLLYLEVPLDASPQERDIKEELKQALDSLKRNSLREFSLRIEEFILLFSRHIFQQERGNLLEENNLSTREERKILWAFESCDRKLGRKRETFLSLLEEMERIVGDFRWI